MNYSETSRCKLPDELVLDKVVAVVTDSLDGDRDNELNENMIEVVVRLGPTISGVIVLVVGVVAITNELGCDSTAIEEVDFTSSEEVLEEVL